MSTHDSDGFLDMTSVLDLTEAAIVVMAPDGIIVHANRRAEGVLGGPYDQIIGTRYDDAQWNLRSRDGRSLEAHEYPVARALAGEDVVDAELLVGSPDQTRALLASARPLRGPDGAITFVVTTSVDVTDVARIERDLAASRSRLSAIFDHASEGIVLADDERRYVAVNPAAARMLGMTVDQLLALRIEDVYERPLAPDRAELERRGRTFDTKQQFQEFVASGAHNDLTVLRGADGREVIVEGKAVPNVEPGLHLAVWRDVTERQRMQQEAARSHARLSTVVEGSSYGLLLCDADGRVVLANAMATGLLRSDEVEGQQLEDVLRSLDMGPDVLQELTRPTGSVSREVVTLADGTSVELRATGVRMSGGTVLSVEDVTAREQLELALRNALQQERAAADELVGINSMKDTFISAVSHELRTPLTVIAGLGETLLDRGEQFEAASRHELVSRIVTNTARLRELLDDLLDLDRLNRGGSLVTRSPVRLPDLISSVVDAIDLGATSFDVDLEVEDTVVEVDATKVQRIVENLVSNAVRHTPDGTRVAITAARTDDTLVIDVVDDGPGFPDELRESAFEMFVKGSSGPARASGTGVGLALVREFARAMAGEAEVVPADGGHVRVTLPLNAP